MDAVTRRDAEAAATRLARHLSRTGLMVLLTIAPGYEPVAVRAAVRQVIGPTEDNPRARGRGG
jgi:hypothetical protein